MPQSFRVAAEWDAEAHVWWASSPDVPGFVTEAPTLEELTDRAMLLIPELVKLERGATVEVCAHTTRTLQAA